MAGPQGCRLGLSTALSSQLYPFQRGEGYVCSGRERDLGKTRDLVNHYHECLDLHPTLC